MESKSFSSRGIQQEDVWSAADSLIADGLRPTIERVRQKIGRGSPNTVSPMLESWFATLATRLGVYKQDDASSDLPEALQQALKTAWEIALSKGREASALEIVQAQDDLTQATQALSEREAELVRMEQVRAVKHQTLEDAVNSAKSIADGALERLSEAQRLVSRRETEIHELQNRLVAVETARDADRRQNQQTTTEYHQERKKMEERAQATQHRWLEEIDRARQEIKRISSEAETAEKKFSAEKIVLEKRIQTQEQEQSRVQALYTAQSTDLHTLRETFTVFDSQSHEIQVLLKAQLDDSKIAVARLTSVLLRRGDGSVAEPRFLGPKFKRARGVRKG